MKKLGVFEVTMFKAFSVTRRFAGQTWVVTEQDNASRKMWLLIKYLFWNANQKISRETLIDLLWGDDAVTDPGNSLKALVFRARNALREGLGLPAGAQIFLFQGGCYCCNSPEMEIHLDVAEFDALAESALRTEGDTGLSAHLNALTLYRGDFLPANMDNSWVAPLSAFYHARFLRLCEGALALLREAGRQQEIIQLCRHAIEIEPYDESLHCALMRALLATGAAHTAMQHYMHTTETFMNQFGVSPSDELTALYKEISAALQSTELDLQAVRQDLEEDGVPPGAFFCGYATFKEIYRQQARSGARTGQTVQLAMLTLSSGTPAALTQNQIHAGMKSLRDSLSQSLRIGDTVTQFSPTQYLVMLPTASYENAKMVMNRILEHYRAHHARARHLIRYSLLPLLPVMK